MSYCILKPALESKHTLAHYRAQAVRRLNATAPKEEEMYVDTRNLWKGSTITQDKQYEAVRKSGMLSVDRKMTFLRFNYRYAEDKNLCFSEAYHSRVIKPKSRIFQQLKK